MPNSPRNAPVFDYRTGGNGARMASDYSLGAAQMFKINGDGERVKQFKAHPPIHEVHGGVRVHNEGKSYIFFHK